MEAGADRLLGNAFCERLANQYQHGAAAGDEIPQHCQAMPRRVADRQIQRNAVEQQQRRIADERARQRQRQPGVTFQAAATQIEPVRRYPVTLDPGGEAGVDLVAVGNAGQAQRQGQVVEPRPGRDQAIGGVDDAEASAEGGSR